MGLFRKIFTRKEDMDDIIKDAERNEPISKEQKLDAEILKQKRLYAKQEEAFKKRKELVDKKKHLSELKQKTRSMTPAYQTMKYVGNKISSVYKKGIKSNGYQGSGNYSLKKAYKQKIGDKKSRFRNFTPGFISNGSSSMFSQGNSFGSGLAVDRQQNTLYHPGFLVDTPQEKKRDPKIQKPSKGWF
jgi:vacuolar-type H+-ATPase subunit H